MNEKYHFFYGGPFSQWYPSVFKEEINGKVFCCAEQYMMYNKAMTFNDIEIARKILKATEPKEYKHLGRQVKGFDAEYWSSIARDIVYDGNFYKFSQNKHLLEKLKKTAGQILVECSPTDRIWGIGRGLKDDLRLSEKTWNGTNWLGYTLTDVRIHLIGE